jgi:mannose-6-phosphate isomerase-like protein (cupin superfamily)
MAGPQPPRFAVAHLDEIEPLPGPGTLTWRPVRARLGIRAFGTNAYTATEAGQDVVEPHTESAEVAHEELYFVARGRATFRLDDEEIDAPAGTYVFVRDPAVHRHAVAAEADTTVLSFGGPATFTPSAWEWFFRADPIVDSDPERARAIIDEGLEAHPDSAGLNIYVAKLEARAGRLDAAREALRRALARQPEAVELAREDEHLAPLLDEA